MPQTREEDAETRLRVNWIIPAPIIIALAIQAIGVLWVGATWKATFDSTILILDGRIAAVEKNIANNIQIVERVKGVEVNIDALKTQNQRIEQKLDTALERRC